MNPRIYFFLTVLCSVFAFYADAQVPDSARVSGTWVASEREGLDADELTFSLGDKLVISSMGMILAGRYEIDSSKSPNLLVFYLDSAPGKKSYASINIKSDKEIRLSHLCDGTLEALARQPIVTFLRK